MVADPTQDRRPVALPLIRFDCFDVPHRHLDSGYMVYFPKTDHLTSAVERLVFELDTIGPIKSRVNETEGGSGRPLLKFEIC